MRRGTCRTISARARRAMAAVTAPYSGVSAVAQKRFATSSCTITTSAFAFFAPSMNFMTRGVVM